LILGGDGYLGWPTAPAFSRQGHRVALVDKLRQAATIVRHRTSSGTCSAERERMISETSFRLTAKDYPWLLPLTVVGAVATGCKRAVTRVLPAGLGVSDHRHHPNSEGHLFACPDNRISPGDRWIRAQESPVDPTEAAIPASARRSV
jgi:NAD(P)-dependent dehydrogenase (short-subunit alcohol dehydrogenase family)